MYNKVAILKRVTKCDHMGNELTAGNVLIDVTVLVTTALGAMTTSKEAKTSQQRKHHLNNAIMMMEEILYAGKEEPVLPYNSGIILPKNYKGGTVNG